MTTTTQTRIEIASKKTGTRTICGTDWTVEDCVIRDQRPGKRRPEWILVRGLCNGIPSSSQTYPTRAAAIQAL